MKQLYALHDTAIEVVEIPTWVLKNNLPPKVRLLYLFILFRCQENNTFPCTTSEIDLATHMRDASSITRTLNALRDLGLVSWQTQRIYEGYRHWQRIWTIELVSRKEPTI